MLGRPHEVRGTVEGAGREELLARMAKTSHAKHREPAKRTPRRGTEAVPAAAGEARVSLAWPHWSG